MGSRLTVFPRAAWACLRRGLARDADVVLEVVNGITFLTPLWLRRPRVALVHHIHRDHYVAEMGRPGAVAALLAETLPLRLLYRDTTFLTISEAGRHDLLELGLPADRIHVAYLGVEPPPFAAAPSARRRRGCSTSAGSSSTSGSSCCSTCSRRSPTPCLDIAGDGDHREALEAEIAARGLARPRRRCTGTSARSEKAALLSRSWVNLTASSAEGWCLTVMEAAMYRTPSAALAVGGLPESIEDGRTGLLADDGAGADRAGAARSSSDRELRERLGDDRARPRDRLHVGAHGAREPRRARGTRPSSERAGLRASLRGSETLKAAGPRGGDARLQRDRAAVHRAVRAAARRRRLRLARRADLDLPDPRGARARRCRSSWRARSPRARSARATRLASTLAAWRRAMLLALVAVTACSVLLREQIADAARRSSRSGPPPRRSPTGCLWLLLSIERGALQGVHAYREVGWSIVLEAGGRLVSGLLLVALGLGVTGAYLGTPVSMARDRGRARGDRAPADRRRPTPRTPRRGCATSSSGAWPAVIGLFLVAVLQNVDVILVKRTIGGDAAGAYAAAAVAAKAVVWVAIGVGLYLLPEATRKAGAGEDPRPVLLRALGVVAVVAVPMLIVYAVAPVARAAARVRRGDRPGRGRAARARRRDDAAGRGLPVRAVHARAARDALPDRARRRRGGRDRRAVGHRAEEHRRLRDGRARAAGGGGAGRARARARPPTRRAAAAATA